MRTTSTALASWNAGEEMTRYLLDTDAVIDYVAGIPGSVTLIDGLFESGNVLCVSAVVVAEVYAGLTPGDIGKSEGFVGACVFLPTGFEEARQAGEWAFQFKRRGVTLSLTDTLIAATARSHGATIVTANIRDYPMPEVSILSLPRANRKSEKA